MTAFADLRRAIEKRFWFSKLRNGDFTSHVKHSVANRMLYHSVIDCGQRVWLPRLHSN
jgi:hypothetical protein